MQTPPTKSYNIPDEFQKFVSEYQELLRKHPKAATRFGLVDLGNNHVRTRGVRDRLRRSNGHHDLRNQGARTVAGVHLASGFFRHVHRRATGLT